MSSDRSVLAGSTYHLAFCVEESSCGAPKSVTPIHHLFWSLCSGGPYSVMMNGFLRPASRRRLPIPPQPA